MHETIWGLIGLSMAVAALMLQDQGTATEKRMPGIP
jgi:hypothetical protein